MDNNENRLHESRLRELGGSDFEIKDEQPNIKGWKVKNESDQTIGEVDELIFDTQALKVRYMVLDLDDNDWDMESKKVLVPIGLAELDKENDHVILPGVTLDQILLLPEYNKDDLTSEIENSIRNAFAKPDVVNPTSNTETTNDFYNHDHFDEGSLNRRRRIEGNTTMPDDPFN